MTVLSMEMKKSACAVLESAPDPLSVADLERALILSKRTAYRIVGFWKAHYGARLVREHCKYSLLEDPENPKPIRRGPFKLPDDLMRGWIDPVTGVVPSHLGL